MQIESLVGEWSTPLGWAALAGVLMALFGVAGCIASARRRRFPAALGSGIVTLLLLSLSATFAAVAVGVRGFETLTRESIAAHVQVRPVGRQIFEAEFRLPSGQVETYVLRGDELYVDAHILKWKSAANWFGLHTQYELDRVAGRYRELEDEQQAPRTVYGLARPRRFDLFQLVRKSARFSPLVDAEYGSATFILAERTATFEIRVSTSGLLIREVATEARSLSAPNTGS